MTQQHLAEAAGVPQPSIARIERGTVQPRTSTLIELLAATGHRLAVEPIGASADADESAIRKRLAKSVPHRTRAAMASLTPIRILRRLRLFNVPFVLIGELAEAAHGAPITVGPLIEVCHASTDVAAERLALARKDLGRAAGPSRLRLVTRTDAGDDYDVLARNATGMLVDSGILVRVASLDDLIRIRRARQTPADEQAADLLVALDDVRSEPRGVL